MINSSFFIGKPASFEGICKIYSPLIKDIVDNKNYPVYKKLLLNSQEDIEDEFAEQKKSFETLPTPLEYIFALIASDERLKQIVVDAFEFFIHEPVTLLDEQKLVIIGDLNEILPTLKSIEDLRCLSEANFFEFQNMVREAVGEKTIEPYNPDENPKIKYFKAKARLRDRVKAQSKDSLTLGSTLAVISCMDLGLTPLNIGEISQAALTALMRYSQEKSKYEIDIQSLLAGADSKKIKPVNWIRNIED